MTNNRKTTKRKTNRLDTFEQLWQTHNNQRIIIISLESQPSFMLSFFTENFIAFSQTSFCNRHTEGNTHGDFWTVKNCQAVANFKKILMTRGD